VLFYLLKFLGCQLPVYDKSVHGGRGDRVGYRSLENGKQFVFRKPILK